MKKKHLRAILVVTSFLVLVCVAIITVVVINSSRSLAPKDTQAGNTLTDAGGPAATLNEYWNGNGEWKLAAKISLQDHRDWNAGFTTQGEIVPQDSTWYLVSRKIEANRPECPTNGNTLSTEIRVSTDKGNTFSAPVDMVTADKGTPWECAVTDGGLYYAAQTKTWYFLAQCLAAQGGWNGCIFERKGTSPVGKFTSRKANPVIRSGDLWKQICAQGKNCQEMAKGGMVGDEGTFEIIEYNKPYYYVGFHGFANPYGFRGIAKTKNFVQWIVVDTDLPNDTFMTIADVKGWKEQWHGAGSIGVGNVSILKENQFYYALAEAADQNLGCEVGQNWDVGVFRSSSLSSARWQQFPQGNPIIFSSKEVGNEKNSLPCNVAYASLFQGDDGVYMSMLRDDKDWNYRGMYIYKLVKTGNVLKNADFWKCGFEDWTQTGVGTNVAVYRQPSRSSDGNCFLAANCGSDTCVGDQSVYQDVPLPRGSTAVSFGAQVALDSAVQDGRAKLVLWELGGSAPIPHELSVDGLDGGYKSFSQSVSVHPETTSVRLQLYLIEGMARVGSYRVDEAFVVPR